MANRYLAPLTAAALAVAASPTASTAAPVSGWLGVEAGQFQWEEFVDGSRELRERGPTLRLGGGVDNHFRAESGWLFRGAGWLNLAEVDYEGTAQELVDTDGDGDKERRTFRSTPKVTTSGSPPTSWPAIGGRGGTPSCPP